LIAKYHENLFKSGSKAKFGTEMGQKNTKGTVTIINANGRIRLRWRFKAIRHSISLGEYTKSNLIQARIIALKIEQDILLNNFDKTLNSYSENKSNKSQVYKSIVELFEEWVKDYKQMDCEIHTNYNSTRNMLRKWGKITEENITNKLNKEKVCNTTYNRRLRILKNFSLWLINRKIWTNSYLDEVNPKKVKKSTEPKRSPFTNEEIGSILKAFKDDTFTPNKSAYKHSHYYPFIYFLFKTGVRNAEAIGLRVSSINLETNQIQINEAFARSLKGSSYNKRIRKETKNGKERNLPLTPDLKEVLWAIIQNKNNDDLVFQSPKGKSIDDHNFQTRVFKKVQKGLGIQERVLYACRHTFGSRCIDSGISPVMTAFLMGNSPEVALKNYTHQLQIPKNLPEI
jgi:integrase